MKRNFTVVLSTKLLEYGLLERTKSSAYNPTMSKIKYIIWLLPILFHASCQMEQESRLEIPVVQILHLRDHMKEAVVNGGIPFQNVYGMSNYEYSAVDPRFSMTFNKAMQGHTTTLMKKILEAYKGFEQLGQLMDVAGGTGANLSLITAKYPNIKGINFDLPHVVAVAPTFPGVEHVGGDMFTNVPTAETIFLKWILHNWSDEQCVKLLKNYYASLPEHGKMIVVESVASSATEANVWATSVFLIDIIMMQYFGGRERSHEEFEALAKEAGFCGIKAVCCVNNFTVMEFYKKV